MATRRRFLAAMAGLATLASAGLRPAGAQSPVSIADTGSPLRDYLGLIPTSVANLEQGVPFLMGDAWLQAETLGISLPLNTDDEAQVHAWQLATTNVPIPEILRRTDLIYSGMPRVTGYELSQVYSGVETGDPANMVTLVRGELDPDAIIPVLERNGYQRIEREGHIVYSVAAGPTQVTVPAIESLPGRLFNATFLDDGTLVYAPKLDLIDAVLAPDATLLDLPAIAQAVDTLDEPLIAAALAGPGALLPDTLFDLTPANDVSAWPVGSPVPLAAIVGSTAGGPIQSFATGATPIPAPNGALSRSKIALVYPTGEDVTTAASQIEDRLATERSLSYEQAWSDLFATWSVEPNQDQASVLVTIEWRDVPSKALTLLYRRDLGVITG